MTSSIRPRGRVGFTLIELLVVIAIIAILIGLLLPAVQKVREAAARSTCSNNMKQMGLGIHNFESSFGVMPSVGQCESSTGTVTYTTHGWAVWILPYIEQGAVYNQLDTSYNALTDATYRPGQQHPKSRGRAYDDPAQPGGSTNPQYINAGRTKIKTYVCPSTPIGNDQRDPVDQFGGIDYMAVALTDIITGPTASSNQPGFTGYGTRGGIIDRIYGAMTCDGRAIVNIQDGSSNTLLLIEDAGRAYPTVGTYGAFSSTNRFSAMTSPLLPIAGGGGTNPGRRVFAWIDADAATNGVSGPNNSGASKIAKINNNNNPIGGPSTCLWSVNNCGPNDEPFAFHPGGCMATMGDGSVRFIRDSIDPGTLKFVSGSDDGVSASIE